MANFLFQNGYVESNLNKLKEESVTLESSCYNCEIIGYTGDELKENSLPLSVYKVRVVEREGGSESEQSKIRSVGKVWKKCGKSVEKCGLKWG